MAKIVVDADCGNAPKKEFLKQLSIAFAEKNMDFILERVIDDIKLEVVGQSLFQGKNEFLDILKEALSISIEEIKVDGILTHGKESAMHGIVKTLEGKEYSFCNVCEFSGAKGTKIKSIKSYIIEINECFD